MFQRICLRLDLFQWSIASMAVILVPFQHLSALKLFNLFYCTRVFKCTWKCLKKLLKTEMFSVHYNFYVSKSTYYRYRADYFDSVNNVQSVTVFSHVSEVWIQMEYRWKKRWLQTQSEPAPVKFFIKKLSYLVLENSREYSTRQICYSFIAYAERLYI